MSSLFVTDRAIELLTNNYDSLNRQYSRLAGEMVGLRTSFNKMFNIIEKLVSQKESMSRDAFDSHDNDPQLKLPFTTVEEFRSFDEELRNDSNYYRKIVSRYQ